MPALGNGTAYSVATSVVRDSAGRFIIAGAAQCQDASVNYFNCVPFVARLLSDGSLDPSFGTLVPGGMRSGVLLASTHSARLDAVAFDAEGRIVATGRSYGDALNADRCFVLLGTSDGVLDPHFGEDGTTAVDLARGKKFQQQRCNSVVAEPNGALTLAGVVFEGGSTTMTVVTRVREDGKVDTTFGEQGATSFPYPGPTGVQGTYAGVTHALDGKLLVLTVSPKPEDDGNAAVVRLTP